jgi:MFS family permease
VPPFGRLHRAWGVAGITFAVLLSAAAFRSSMGVLLVPLEEEFGWSRTDTSAAVAVNLLLYGLTAPFAAALMERVGIRRVVVAALLLIAAGCGLSAFMTQSWQLVALWGVAVGLGTGATALVFGALVANRWFVARRGLVLGILGTAWATGQLVFLPLIAWLATTSGWRTAVLMVAAISLALVPLVLLLLADRPSDVGLRPYGAEHVDVGDTAVELGGEPARVPESSGGALAVLAMAARHRTFWLLAGTFFVCGWTSNGIISTHWVPAAHDHGLPATTAAGLLAVVGLFDIVGSLGSGWLTDRVDPRLLLLAYYVLRGVALLSVPALLGPDVELPLLLVVVLFGLDWVATVPPTVTLCREAFGVDRGAIVFGWVFAAHMIGAAVAAQVSGAMRAASGDYTAAWLLSGGLAIAAGAAALLIPRARTRVPVPA